MIIQLCLQVVEEVLLPEIEEPKHTVAEAVYLASLGDHLPVLTGPTTLEGRSGSLSAYASQAPEVLPILQLLERSAVVATGAT